jgi:acyl-CoA reductase-like NAD-dependent aldehyde dehydrogenase
MQQEVFGPILPVLEIESVDEAIAGNSGMGKYHGEWGFRAYTNARGVLHHSTMIDSGVHYPPYSENERLRGILGRLIA